MAVFGIQAERLALLEEFHAGKVAKLHLVALGQGDGLLLPLKGLGEIAVFRVDGGQHGEVAVGVVPVG